MKQELTLQDFHEWLEIKQLSQQSLKQYRYYFQKLTTSYPLTPQGMSKFLQRYNNGVARSFLNNLLQYIRTNQQDLKETFSNFQLPRVTGRKKLKLPTIIQQGEVHTITEHLSNPRNKIMVLISFYGGLRAAEVLNIKPYDFYWEEWLKDQNNNGKLKVTGKGSRQRIVFLPANLMQYTYKWIREKASQKQTPENPLFNIKYHRWRDIFQKASYKALKKKIGCHTLRHSNATFLLDKGLTLQEIKEYLGHESITTTQIYAHINKNKLKEKINQIF